jgi:hypothetical protein
MKEGAIQKLGFEKCERILAQLEKTTRRGGDKASQAGLTIHGILYDDMSLE